MREQHAIDCPDSRIELQAQRAFGSRRVYALDACGTKVELEYGLRLPGSFTNIPPLSPEEIAVLRREFQSPHRGVEPAVKEEIGHWCREGDALVPGESREQCRARLSSLLVPLGQERSQNGDHEHWFIIHDRAFSVRAALYRPPCEHSLLLDAGAACRCRGDSGCAEPPKQSAAAPARPPSNEASPEPASARVYTRGDIGGGYWSMRLNGADKYDGAVLSGTAYLGLMLDPSVVFGVEVSHLQGLAERSYSREVCLEGQFCTNATGRTHVNFTTLLLRTRVYPMRRVGLHMDAAVGAAFASQHFDGIPLVEKNHGVALSLGAGYEVVVAEAFLLGAGGRGYFWPGSELAGAAVEVVGVAGVFLD